MKKIRLTESDLNKIITESVKRILSEAGRRVSASDFETGTEVATRPKPKPQRKRGTGGKKTKWNDEHCLDNIQYLDPSSIRYILKGIVGTIKSDTLFKPIHQLVKFFDPKRNNVAGKRMVYGILDRKMPDYHQKVSKLTECYNKILALVKSPGSDFAKLDEFNILLGEIFPIVEEFAEKVIKAGATDPGSTIVAIEGGHEGRDVGLRRIIWNTQSSLRKLSNLTAKLEELVKKGQDPLTVKTSIGRRH